MRVEIPEDSLTRNPGQMEIMVWDEMPNVPYWILIDLNAEAHPFWTLPAGHYFERSSAQFGPPKRLHQIALDYTAGMIERDAAEAQMLRELIEWSGATTGSTDESPR